MWKFFLIFQTHFKQEIKCIMALLMYIVYFVKPKKKSI